MGDRTKLCEVVGKEKLGTEVEREEILCTWVNKEASFEKVGLMWGLRNREN